MLLQFVTLGADEIWHDTLIAAVAGQTTFIIEATGQWTISATQITCSAAGTSKPGTTSETYMLPGHPRGALLGKFSRRQEAFCLRAKAKICAGPADGSLLLMINDDPSTIKSNTGKISVRVVRCSK